MQVSLHSVAQVQRQRFPAAVAGFPMLPAGGQCSAEQKIEN